MLLRKLRAYVPTPAFPSILFASGNGSHEFGLSTTAWLDGVRGFAAFIVATDHILWSYIGFRFQGFHAQPVDVNTSFLQLPPFRIIFGMRAMVPLFFVVSGYCLSIQFVRRLRKSPEDTSALFNALSSAMFRRGIRLFVPFMSVVLVSQVLLYLGAYEWKGWGDAELVALTEDSDGNPIHAPIREHLRFLYLYLGTVVEALNQGFGSPATVGLNPTFWTIPAEFRGSLLIYLCFLGLARVRHVPRVCILVAIAFVLLVEGMWELWAFIGGLLIAELHEWSGLQPSQANDEATFASQKKGGRRRGAMRPSRAAVLLLFTLGLYLLCVPVQDANHEYGVVYGIINPLTPRKWKSRDVVDKNCHSLGAMLCIAALGVEPVLRRPFESRLGQYLGRISFTLYLVHMLVARTLISRTSRLFCFLAGSKWRAPANLFSKISVVLIALWVSESLVEVLDKRSVVLAKRLFERWLVR